MKVIFEYLFFCGSVILILFAITKFQQDDYFPISKTYYKTIDNIIRNDQFTEEEDQISPSRRRKVLLFIGITSSFLYKHRRNAMRETWLKGCVVNCAYKFLLDSLDTDLKLLGDFMTVPTYLEMHEHHDIVLLNTPTGVNFALRMYHAILYATKHFEFDYFLRIDDDYFLCLDRMLYELPRRPVKRLYWGYPRCNAITTLDEGLIVVSKDLITDFVQKKDTLLCSPYGTEAIASWVYDAMRENGHVDWFTDKRILHHPPVERSPTIWNRSEICHTYVAFHGAWSRDVMVRLHQIQMKEQNFKFEIPAIKDICPTYVKGMNTTLHQMEKRHICKPCKTMPVVKDKGPYQGRESQDRTYYVFKKLT